LSEYVGAIAVDGNNVYVGGTFTDAANISAADYIAKWDGSQWSALGNDGAGDGAIKPVAPYFEGVDAIALDGSNIYIGGLFADVNNYGSVIHAADYIAKWDGSNWLALGSDGHNDGALKNQVRAIRVSGPTLYAGGYFRDVNNNGTLLRSADRIARYGIQPATYYVKWNATGSNNGTSWNDAYEDLQSALAAASSGDEIWVASGIYKPTTGTDRTISFALKNGVAIYGGFAGIETLRTERDPAANVATLSGDIGVAANISDNSYHVVTGSNVDSTTVLDGFTITNGNASDNLSFDLGSGGGMSNQQSSPTLSNLIFTLNRTYFHGGGIYNLNNSNPRLDNVTFSSNTAGSGGGMENTFSNPVLTNVIFIGNISESSGGAIYNSHSDPNLTNVTFSNNSSGYHGGGIYNVNSSPNLINVTFSGNTAGYAGGGMSSSSNSNPTLTNVTFNANAAVWGGGMYNFFSNPIITNVTLSGNTATYGAGIYDSDLSHPVIKNSILWGNSGGEITNVNSSTPIVTYSIVQGGYIGTSNLDRDPLLGVLTNNGGFTKTMAILPEFPGSSAIDAGDNASCPDTDQRGVKRPQGARCDIGAYEFDEAYVDSKIGMDLKGSYGVAHGESNRQVYASTNNGPVQIASKNLVPIVASEGVVANETSYSEMMGYPDEQLTTEYLFPFYNNVDFDGQLRVSNVGGANTTITVYLGSSPTPLDSFPLGIGEAVRKNYGGKRDGPMRVVSSASNILTTLRSYIASSSSYSELLGYPANQLTDEYIFPYYNNVAFDSQLRVSNVGGADTTITVYLGSDPTPLDSFPLAAGAASRTNYGGKQGGPLRVVSSASNILTTIRAYVQGKSYSELMGYPVNQPATEFWYPIYDNVTLDSQLRVSNIGAGPTTITVYFGNNPTPIDSFPLAAGQVERRNYGGKNGGPLHVVSSAEPILTTIRLYKVTGGTPSYYELTGLADSQVSTQYWFPWYNNVQLNTEVRFAVP
jgi:predicted outer membrane repeat protein